SGRLCVSLTRLADGRNLLVSQFDSREELVQVENSRWAASLVPGQPVPLCPAGPAVQLFLPCLLWFRPSFLPRGGEDGQWLEDQGLRTFWAQN
ncbi:unnamed protein product, partial [Tetraodon nigroviridis]